MKRPVRPQIGGTASAEADLEAALERARESYEEERAFFRRLLDATVYVHAPVSDDSKTPRLVQFRHPDGFDAIPFFLSLAKAQVAGLQERLGRLTPKHYRPRGRAAPVKVGGEGPLFGDHGGRVARGHWLNGVDED